MSGWLAAAVVSAIAHVGFAAWVEQAEPKSKPRPPIEMQLAKLPRKLDVPPVVPPPPPPPPAPPKKPVLVKKVAKTLPPPPPPPETQRVGISEDATTDRGEVAVSTGVTTDGVIGTGTNMNAHLPPPPPEAPAPPPPPPPVPQVHKPKFFPSYEVTQLPRIKKASQPTIPDAFRQAQREALVVIEVEIDARGRVVGARVMRHADYGLDDAALAAARSTEFEPALMGTQPVPVRYQLPYRFKVRG